MSEYKIDTSDLTDITDGINYYFELFIKSFPDNKNTEECIKFVIDLTMKDTKGKLNPIIIEQMVRIHKFPLINSGFSVQLC